MNLTFKKVDKNGFAVYGIEGVRGSIYFSKSILEGEPPASMEVAYEGFAAPGTPRAASVPREVTPEKAEKARLAAEKSEERARKATERAQKAVARAAKYAEKVAGKPTAETVPA